MTDTHEELWREAEADTDVQAIFEQEYKLVLANEIAREIRANARMQAEEEIQRRRANESGISR